MMVGEELSSTDLHLANGDTLLVGQVAEVEQVDSLDASAANRPHYRKLQVHIVCSGLPFNLENLETWISQFTERWSVASRAESRKKSGRESGGEELWGEISNFLFPAIIITDVLFCPVSVSTTWGGRSDGPGN